ncbi:hypothetical protein BDZ89DRAFT_1109552 [Hymenopellis radicata]|nr:hypothetical protein BDZ89DRAFT_1109552 [Hymenopellis radicata]
MTRTHDWIEDWRVVRDVPNDTVARVIVERPDPRRRPPQPAFAILPVLVGREVGKKDHKERAGHRGVVLVEVDARLMVNDTSTVENIVPVCSKTRVYHLGRGVRRTLWMTTSRLVNSAGRVRVGGPLPEPDPLNYPYPTWRVRVLHRVTLGYRKGDGCTRTREEQIVFSCAPTTPGQLHGGYRRARSTQSMPTLLDSNREGTQHVYGRKMVREVGGGRTAPARRW